MASIDTYGQLNRKAVQNLPDSYPHKETLLKHWQINSAGFNITNKEYIARLKEQINQKWSHIEGYKPI
jgi:hypothetical protein